MATRLSILLVATLTDFTLFLEYFATRVVESYLIALMDIIDMLGPIFDILATGLTKSH